MVDDDDGNSDSDSNFDSDWSANTLDSATHLPAGIDNINTSHVDPPPQNVNDNTNSATSIDGFGIRTSTISEGLGTVHLSYGSIFADCIHSVFKIATPKDW